MALSFGLEVKLCEVFFVVLCFLLCYQKYEGDFDENMTGSFIHIWHMTLLFLTFSWPTSAYTV